MMSVVTSQLRDGESCGRELMKIEKYENPVKVV